MTKEALNLELNMTKDEALKVALEALDTAWLYDKDNADGYYFDAMTAIKEALAQPEPEPVAWMYTSKWKGNERFITRYQTELKTYKADEVWPLYTSPPQRQWVGLTDAEIAKIFSSETGFVFNDNEMALLDFAQAIEAKLKELNT